MIYSKKLLKIKKIVHGFTTQENGDFRQLFNKIRMRKCSNIDYKQLAKIGINENNLFLAQQVHGNKIQEVKSNSPQILIATDGLYTLSRGVILGIMTADCVPIIFYEPSAPLVAVVHAGCRGMLAKIVPKMIKTIKTQGGNIKNLIVVIGPHIKKCCYDINKDKYDLIKDKLGTTNFITSDKNKYFLDLSKAVLKQLTEIQVPKGNIEDIDICTYDSRKFFSFRRSKREKSQYGEMLAFIGLT